LYNKLVFRIELSKLVSIIVVLTVILLWNILYQRWKAEISMYSLDSRVEIIDNSIIRSIVLELDTIPLKHNEISTIALLLVLYLDLAIVLFFICTSPI
jgi:hypothetical protein